MDDDLLLIVLLRAAVTSSLAILLVIMLRLAVRKAFGAGVAYSLWLLVPLATLAAFLPARRTEAPLENPAPIETVSTAAAEEAALLAESDRVSLAVVKDVAKGALRSFEAKPAHLLTIWIVGVGLSLLLLHLRQRRFLASLSLRPYTARSDVWIAADARVGPALVGALRPKIMVPADFAERYTEVERNLVIAHERAHLKAFDAQTNALAALAVCFNWYNPLFYIARALFRADQELARDEDVVGVHQGARRAYAEAMLKTQLAARVVPLGCHWPALGVEGLKTRIALLARPRPVAARRAMGSGICAAIALTAGVVAWAAQPPRPALDPNAPNATIFSALGAQLVEAILVGDRDLVRALIEAGADVDYFLAGDGTPLVAAAYASDRQVAELLLAADADVNHPAPGDGNPLIVAAGRNDMELVRLFVAAGADVDGFVRGDETPLINAARSNAIEAARFLIESGADVNLEVEAPTTRGVEGRSPLSEARKHGHDAMIRLLMEGGAGP